MRARSGNLSSHFLRPVESIPAGAPSTDGGLPLEDSILRSKGIAPAIRPPSNRDLDAGCLLEPLELRMLAHLPPNSSPMIFSCRGRRAASYQPKTQEKIKGTTIVASDSMMNLGVSSESLPQVIFSFGTAPE